MRAHSFCTRERQVDVKGIGEVDDVPGSLLKDIPGQAAVWLEVTFQSRALSSHVTNEVAFEDE
jgi:hypothetical protein